MKKQTLTFDELEDLNAVLTRQKRSVSHYLSQINSSVIIDRHDLFHLYEFIGVEEADLADQVWDLIEERGEAPHIGPYTMDYTCLNYTGTSNLLRYAVQDKENTVRILQGIKDRNKGKDFSGLLEDALRLSKGHLDQLLDAAKPVPAEPEN